MAYILFGLTVLFSSMVYLNLRIVYSGEAVIVTAYVISIIRILMERKFTGTDYIYTIVLVLSGIAAAESVKLLIRFNAENNAVIQDNYAKQNLTGIKMTEVAGEISSLFEKAKENIENLRGVIESNHSGMQNIATSMESTAQEITDQATKCQEIQEHDGFVNISLLYQEQGRFCCRGGFCSSPVFTGCSYLQTVYRMDAE